MVDGISNYDPVDFADIVVDSMPIVVDLLTYPVHSSSNVVDSLQKGTWTIYWGRFMLSAQNEVMQY